MSTPTNRNGRDDGHSQWTERLQDWLDGDLDAAHTAAMEEHLAHCAACRDQAAELRLLDAELQAAAPRLSLGEGFDRRVLAHIEGVDEQRRAAHRQRAREEFAAGLQALTRGWRRALALAVSGGIAGMALAFALFSHFESATLAQALAAEGASDLARHAYQLATTGLLGAGIGAAIARWLATATE